MLNALSLKMKKSNKIWKKTRRERDDKKKQKQTFRKTSNIDTFYIYLLFKVGKPLC